MVSKLISGRKLKVKVVQLCPAVRLHRHSLWNSPGQNIGLGSLSLLQGIFPTQGLNPGLLPCGQILFQLNYQGSPLVAKPSGSWFQSLHQTTSTRAEQERTRKIQISWPLLGPFLSNWRPITLDENLETMQASKGTLLILCPWWIWPVSHIIAIY